MLLDTEIKTAQTLVPEVCAFEFQISIENYKDTNHLVLIKSQQILLRQGREQFSLRPINLLFLIGIRKKCLRIGRSRSMYLSIRRAMKQILVIVETYHMAKYIQTFIQHPAVKVTFILLLGIIIVDFDTTGQLLIIYCALVKYWRKNWEQNEAVLQLCIDLKTAMIHMEGSPCTIFSLTLLSP
jgi:hypothetical protein